MVLLAEIEHEEVTDELAALYTDVLLQPCQASLNTCSNISLCVAVKLLINIIASLAFRPADHLRRLGGRKCELTVFLARMPPGHTRLSAIGLISTLHSISSVLRARAPK